MNECHFHKLSERSSKHTQAHTHTFQLCQSTGLRNIGAPDPDERRVGRCDRESRPTAKCIISLFVMEQTEPKITVALSAEFWSPLNKLSEPSVGASRPKLMNMAAE